MATTSPTNQPADRSRKNTFIYTETARRLVELSALTGTPQVLLMHEAILDLDAKVRQSLATPTSATAPDWSCPTCGVALEEPRTTPPWHDDAAWHAIAGWHTDDCPWVTTRGQHGG